MEVLKGIVMLLVSKSAFSQCQLGEQNTANSTSELKDHSRNG